MDAHLRKLAAGQADIVAAWQLIAGGWTRRAIEHSRKRGAWQLVHPGVYALTQAPLTQQQRWMAAALTAPETYLSERSAGRCWGFWNRSDPIETVTRVGSGGPRRLGSVRVKRSRDVGAESTARHGIPITTAARTLIDIAPGVSGPAVGRAFREALRLKLLTVRELAGALGRHRGRRGTRVLWDLAERYSDLPYGRTRSNAEARALEILHDARVDTPAVNVRVAGAEADLVWPRRRLIIELDGPQFHRFADEDLRKQRRWERAGYNVRRLSTDVIYADPAALIALVSR